MTFNDILKQVEASQLNYLISKTPFSANISLKCSFTQMYTKPLSKPDQEKLGQHFDANATVKNEKSDLQDKLEKEVLQLKSKLNSLEDTIRKQDHVLEDQSKQLKHTEKVAEEQAAEFREELLKVKRDKNKLATKNKISEDENEMLKNQTANVKKENEKLTEEKKALVNQLKTLKKDNATLDGLSQGLEKKLAKETL